MCPPGWVLPPGEVLAGAGNPDKAQWLLERRGQGHLEPLGHTESTEDSWSNW